MMIGMLVLAYLAREVESVLLPEAEIEGNERDPLAFEHSAQFRAIFRLGDGEAFALETTPQQGSHLWIVVNDQDMYVAHEAAPVVKALTFAGFSRVSSVVKRHAPVVA